MKVSVIIPYYNLGDYIEEAIKSVFDSDYEDFEVIVIDDGSTEQSAIDALERSKRRWGNNPRWRCVRQDNGGAASARNHACRLANGQAILPVDADNKIRRNYITRSVELLMQNPDVGVVYAWAQRFGIVHNTWEFQPLSIHNMLLANGVEACSLFRKEVWESVGGYCEDCFRYGYEDWDFWLSAIEKGWRFELIPEVMFDYRVRISSMVSNCNDPVIRRKLITSIINRHISLYATRWPSLLVDRDVSMLDQYLTIAAYQRIHIESVQEFNRVGGALNDRLDRLESVLQSAFEHIHRLEGEVGNLYWRRFKHWLHMQLINMRPR
jgi:glycosyltransferase involved in cell wall biosynthesis